MSRSWSLGSENLTSQFQVWWNPIWLSWCLEGSSLWLAPSRSSQSLDLKKKKKKKKKKHFTRQEKSSAKELGSFLPAWPAGEGVGGNCAKRSQCSGSACSSFTVRELPGSRQEKCCRLLHLPGLQQAPAGPWSPQQLHTAGRATLTRHPLLQPQQHP